MLFFSVVIYTYITCGCGCENEQSRGTRLIVYSMRCWEFLIVGRQNISVGGRIIKQTKNNMQ